MTPEQAEKLRKAFPPSAIGTLPKPTSKDNPKGNCRECGGYHGLPAVHLDYVGHAAVTDRLLQADPDWTWEPVAFDANGTPAFTPDRGLWIRLTVCGVTRLGYGDGASVKECIGDAIRNAAMRFGVALDLWAKEDLSTMHAEPQPSLPSNSDPAALAVLRDLLTEALSLESLALAGNEVTKAVESGLICEADRLALGDLYREAAANLKNGAHENQAAHA